MSDESKAITSALVTVTMPRALIHQLDAEARADERSRSAYICRLLERRHDNDAFSKAVRAVEEVTEVGHK